MNTCLVHSTQVDSDFTDEDTSQNCCLLICDWIDDGRLLHAQQEDTLSPSHNNCTHWLTAWEGIDAETYLGCFCCGFTAKRCVKYADIVRCITLKISMCMHRHLYMENTACLLVYMEWYSVAVCYCISHIILECLFLRHAWGPVYNGGWFR